MRFVPHPLAAAGALVALATTQSACSLPPVQAQPPDKADSTACRRVAQAWPSTVSGLEPYPVTTPSDAVRAWGERPESAVIARCGVTSPGPTTNTCFAADGVDWVQRNLSDGHQFVTYGREPAIEVLLPSGAHLDGSSLAAFARAAEKIPQGEHRCS